MKNTKNIDKRICSAIERSTSGIIKIYSVYLNKMDKFNLEMDFVNTFYHRHQR